MPEAVVVSAVRTAVERRSKARSPRRCRRRWPDRGVVERKFELVNQHGEICQTGRIDVLVRRSPA